MMKPRFVSLAARNALVYFVLFIVGLSVSGFLVLSYSSGEILKLAEQRLEHTGELVQLKFETYADGLERDLNQLSQSPLLMRYSRDTSLSNLNILQEEYLAVLNSKPNYYQIRLISSKNPGKEIIRVERKGDALILTPEEELQFKGDRDYFTELLELPVDSLYFSKIDLNKEHGKISEPLIPTLRIGKRIKTGVLEDIFLVVNVDLKAVFTELNQLLPKGDELRVVNGDGHYLIHPNPEQEFTFEYDKSGYYEQEYEQPLADMSETEKNLKTETGVSRMFDLNYDRPGYKLYTIVSSKNSTIFASFYVWRNTLIAILIIAAVFFLVVAFFYMRKQVRELKSITTQLMLFSNQPKPRKLTIDRNDEIGALARGFEEMSEKIARSQEQMEKEKQKAEQAYSEKNAFLENMSHEIRNPLQSILGTTQILSQNSVSAQQKPFIDSLRFSTTQLNSLVTDILDYGKIKAGQIELNPDWAELGMFCQEMINSLKYQANAKNINIQLEFQPDLEDHLFYFDRLRLYQILNNLLINALKFTPNNGKVMLRVKLSGDAKNSIQFAVIDTGAGIAKDKIKKITARNYTSNYTTGTGLGLTIVQELLRLHNAQLSIDSVLEEGSSFFFELSLPVKVDHNRNTDKDNRLATNGKKILVLEDDLELQNWYAYLLKGNTLTQCVHTDQLPVLSEKFDLIITDLMFGEKKVELSAHLECLEKYKKPKGFIIVVSGTEITEKKAGVRFFTKPVDKKKVLAAIDSHFVTNVFGTPDYSSLQKDYDQNEGLVKKAIGLLIEEWRKERLKFKEAMSNSNIERFNQIKHKIITSIRRLNLYDFEIYLEKTAEKLKLNGELSENEQSDLLNHLTYFIERLEAYHRSLD